MVAATAFCEDAGAMGTDPCGCARRLTKATDRSSSAGPPLWFTCCIDAFCRAAAVLIAAAFSVCAAAGARSDNTGADDCKGPSDDCVAVGRWTVSVALGGGVRTNPLVNGENIPLVVIPSVSYYGKRFFLNDFDVGFTLAEQGPNQLNLIATPGYDRVYFYRADPQNFFVTSLPAAVSGTAVAIPPPKLSYTTDANVARAVGAAEVLSHPKRITYYAGPEWTFKLGQLAGQFDYVHEITAQNHGDEVRAAISFPLLQSRGTLSANTGFTWKSSDIVNYYYGVSNIYVARSVLDPFVKLGYSQPLSSKWRFNAFVEYEHLGRGIADSPMVAEREVETAFVGAVYTF